MKHVLLAMFGITLLSAPYNNIHALNFTSTEIGLGIVSGATIGAINYRLQSSFLDIRFRPFLMQIYPNVEVAAPIALTAIASKSLMALNEHKARKDSQDISTQIQYRLCEDHLIEKLMPFLFAITTTGGILGHIIAAIQHSR